MAAGAVQMLQKSLLEAQKTLTSTDDAIKKLTGRDPNARPVPRRVSGPALGPGPDRTMSNGGRNGGRMRAWSGSTEGPPPVKRRDSEGGRSRLSGRLGPPPREERERERDEGARRGEPRVFRSRLAGRLGPPPGVDSEEEEERRHKRPVLQSSIVATKVPPRPTATTEDESSKKRNRRMFGFLMGTLQKFKAAEETAKSSEKERRRQEIQEKVEQIQQIEKEEAIQARKDLFEQRKQQKNKIVQLSGQVAMVSMYDEWDAHDKKLIGYIRTRTKPPIFYLPVEHTASTQKRLAQTTTMIEEKIKKRQEEVKSLLPSQQEEAGVEEKTEAMEEEAVKPEGGEVAVVEGRERGEAREKADSDSGEASD